MQIQLEYGQLHKNNVIKEQYAITINLKHCNRMEKQHPGKSLGRYLLKQQKKTLPRKEKQAKSKWITEEILELMQEEQKITKGSPEHKVQHKRLRKNAGKQKKNG